MSSKLENGRKQEGKGRQKERKEDGKEGEREGKRNKGKGKEFYNLPLEGLEKRTAWAGADG